MRSGLTGFILAGGKSRRMGREKAFLKIGSRTLIERVIENLRPCVEHVSAIGHPGNRRQLCDLPLDNVLVDYRCGQGPLMGIYTALMHTETAWNLFVCCDMPWVEAKLIERLLAHCTADVSVIASILADEKVQPFPMLCHVKASRSVGTLLDRGERSVYSLLRESDARLVRVEDPDIGRAFTNVNTQEDYAKLYCAAVLSR